MPTAFYGAVLLLPASRTSSLQTMIIRSQGPDGLLARAVGRDIEGWASLACYAAAIPLALAGLGGVSIAIYVGVALLWVVPDRRIERALTAAEAEQVSGASLDSTTNED